MPNFPDRLKTTPESLGCRLVLGDQLVQAPQISPRLRRSLIGRPGRKFLRGLGIERPRLQFKQNGIVAECHHGMPDPRTQFDARRQVAEQLGGEQADLLRLAQIVEDDQRELPFYREQRLGLWIEGMPVRANIAVDRYRVEQALAGILIALVNIQVLSLPWRLLRCGNQVA